LILVENVTVVLGGHEVLRDVTLTLNRGLHVIIGRNGSGKSTLLKTIAGLIKPSRGRVLVLGEDIHKIPRKRGVRLVGYVWQNPYAGFVEATVRGELEFTEKVAGVSLNEEVVRILVPRHLLDRSPFTLSGGEARRVAMASILALDQPVWLLDEPFDYLDSDGVRAVVKLINYGLERGKTIVVATANVGYLHLLRPSRTLVLSKGVIVYDGDLDSLIPEILEEHGIPSTQQICGV